MRTPLSILAGFLLWTALWLTTNVASSSLMPHAYGADGSVSHAGVLSFFVVASLAFSLLAGFTTARLARDRAALAVGALAVIQVVIGVGVEVAWWALIPAWYHLTFLALLAPGILAGGWLGGARLGGAGDPRPEVAGA